MRVTKGDSMRYERPTITRRELISALLSDTVPSDGVKDGAPSDVHKKDNVVAVAWPDAPTPAALRYETPAVDRRESIVGLATAAPSDNTNDNFQSDVSKKDNVVPVGWSGSEALRYETPGIARRESIAGLADTAPSDSTADAGASDVNVKDNIVPVRW